MLHAKYCFIVLLDFDNFINSLGRKFCNYFNYFDLVMRASSLLAFRCYFELPSINKDFTSLHFMYNIKQLFPFFSLTDELTVITISKYYVMLGLKFTKPKAASRSLSSGTTVSLHFYLF